TRSFGHAEWSGPGLIERLGLSESLDQARGFGREALRSLPGVIRDQHAPEHVPAKTDRTPWLPRPSGADLLPTQLTPDMLRSMFCGTIAPLGGPGQGLRPPRNAGEGSTHIEACCS